MSPSLSVRTLYLISLCLILTITSAQETCAYNQKYASTLLETKCGGKESCRGCKMTLTDSKLLNCGDYASCSDIMASIVARDDFLLECNGESGCRDGFIEIDCRGKDIKGIKCGDKYSCKDMVFLIDAWDQDCLLEKIECDGYESCERTKFIFLGNVTVGDFVCGGNDACQHMQCKTMKEEIVCPGAMPGHHYLRY